MNNAEVCHRWANRTKDKGKAGNIFYKGPVLYSYGAHYPLAVLTGKGEPEIVLVNSRRYSVSTSHHRSLAICASSHKRHIEVPRPLAGSVTDHQFNLEYLNAETVRAFEELTKKRAGIDYAVERLQNCIAAARLYNDLFLDGKGKAQPLPDGYAEALEKAREREAKHDAADAVKQERRQEINALANAEKIAAWRAGENVYLYNVPVMLRMKGKETVETSLRAEIPLAHAERVYRLILGIMAKGEDWRSNGHTIPVGVYKIDSISKDGTLRAGCHTISFEEINRFAAGRGWAE